MKKVAGIYLLSWPIFRTAWHLINTDNSPALKKLYFISVAASISGLFAILYYVAKNGLRDSKYMSVIQFKRLTLWLFIYSVWCFINDSLMIMGIGDKDSIIYTGISIVLLIFPLLWVLFASKH